jgi:hypothetical protein
LESRLLRARPASPAMLGIQTRTTAHPPAPAFAGSLVVLVNNAWQLTAAWFSPRFLDTSTGQPSVERAAPWLLQTGNSRRI